mmetsp:Transcript_71136/g.206327  ORF Transcript_71136/g.206327 Transcript_71136/m.206327 type:complete len:278 (-) Transcript_71136:86-919(-)
MYSAFGGRPCVTSSSPALKRIVSMTTAIFSLSFFANGFMAGTSSKYFTRSRISSFAALTWTIWKLARSTAQMTTSSTAVTLANRGVQYNIEISPNTSPRPTLTSVAVPSISSTAPWCAARDKYDTLPRLMTLKGSLPSTSTLPCDTMNILSAARSPSCMMDLPAVNSSLNATLTSSSTCAGVKGVNRCKFSFCKREVLSKSMSSLVFCTTRACINSSCAVRKFAWLITQTVVGSKAVAVHHLGALYNNDESPKDVLGPTVRTILSLVMTCFEMDFLG